MNKTYNLMHIVILNSESQQWQESVEEWAKIRAIIAYSIKPFLEEQLADKIKSK